jgi:pimeloyl-[acyl-carrier protein] methyl ester esterase
VTSVVLLHGWGVRPAVFDRLRSALSPSYDVLAPALPGYDGVAAREPYDLPFLADYIAASMPERCFVAGWSLGGLVALAWAQRAPAQVERLALLATTPCFVQREAWESAMEPHVLHEFASALEIDVSRTLARFSLLQAKGDTQAKAVVAALRNALASGATTHVTALRGGLDVLLGEDLRMRLQGMRQPALVIHGENDALVPVAAAEYLARELRCATLDVIAGAAHAPFLAAPAAVARALDAFFA